MLRFTDDLRDRHGIPVTSAMHTDVPGAVVGFVDALAASGVRLPVGRAQLGRPLGAVPDRRPGPRPPVLVAVAGRQPGAGLVHRHRARHGLHGGQRRRPRGELRGRGRPAARLSAPGRPTSRCPTARRRSAGACSTPRGSRSGRTRTTCCTCGCRAATPTTPGRPILPPTVVRAWNEAYAYPQPADGHEHRVLRGGAAAASATGSPSTRATGPTGGPTAWAPAPGRWATRGGPSTPSGTRRRCTSSPAPARRRRRGRGDLRPARPLRRAHLGRRQPVARPRGRVRLGRHAVGAQVRDGLLGRRRRRGPAAWPAVTGWERGSRRRTARWPRTWSPTSGRPTAPTSRRSSCRPAPCRSTTPVSIVDARTGSAVPHHEEEQHPRDWPTRPGGRLAQLRGARRAGHRPRAVRRARRRRGGRRRPIDLGQTWQIQNEFYRVDVDPRSGTIASVFDKRAGRELVNRVGVRRPEPVRLRQLLDRPAHQPPHRPRRGDRRAT